MRIEIVCSKQVLHKLIRGRTGRGNADGFSHEILDAVNLFEVLPADHQYQSRIAVEERHHHEMLALRFRADRVLVETGDHVHRSAHHRGQRFRAPAQVGDGNGQPFVLEIAELVRQCEWKVDELRLSPDRHLDVGLVLRVRACGDEDNERINEQEPRSQAGKGKFPS